MKKKEENERNNNYTIKGISTGKPIRSTEWHHSSLLYAIKGVHIGPFVDNGNY